MPAQSGLGPPRGGEPGQEGLRATTVKTLPVFAWSFLLLGDPEPFRERRTGLAEQLGHPLLIFTMCSSLAPSLLLGISPS